MSFKVWGNSFYLNGRKTFLNSGEIHYFRIKRDLWDKHLEAAREAGLMAVSTYVPWAWHENEESVFDFEGSSCPERDLAGWLQRCQAHDLYCIVKPGPFILAEFRGAGLPDWFLERYGDEVKMHNSRGEKVLSDGVSLFNPRYLERVALWYDQIMPFISKREIPAGGPVIMMQICNEIGVFTWLAHQGDYCSEVKKRFISYLAGRYKTVDEMNRLWGTGYESFHLVELPPDGTGQFVSKGDRSRDHDWHCFWRVYYGEYLKMLCRMTRDRGVTVPLYHNLPGWIYGHGYEFPVNITMYSELFNEKSEIVFGVDHIPEFMSYRNMHDDRIINDITAAMQGKKPLFAAELQSGSREYHVVTSPREMELFYKAGIANGLTGWNYYMFSQGRNQPRRGHSGDTFYWFNPLTPEGERTSAFSPVSRMSRILKVSEEIIVDVCRRAEICVLFYPPYYFTELERPAGRECGLQYIPSEIRRPAYFDGLLKVLQILNIDYDMMDLTSSTVEMLSKYRQVWVFCTDEMNAADQQTIIDYVREGGNAVIYPYLPDREMSQKPCSIIRNALEISPSGKETVDSPLIDILNLKDIKCTNPQFIYPEDSLINAEIIARTLNGSACGFVMSLGRGSIIHLGTWTGFDTEGHKQVCRTIAGRSGARLTHASTDSDYLTVRERFTNKDSAILFIANYYNEEHEGVVSYTHPATGENVTIPYTTDRMRWPALYGILTPVGLEVSGKLKILHCTSDILEISRTDNLLAITLYGDRDLYGEIVFEGEEVASIRSASIEDISVEVIHSENRAGIIYTHLHNMEFVLKIRIG
jgi:beta-galactosidase